MSLPPELITVRRKRRAGADDGPVNFLRVEETKRQRSGTWLYRRRQPETQVLEQSSEALPDKPIIHSSRPGDEKIPISARSHVSTANPEAPTGEGMNAPVTLPTSGNAEPRRFHLARFGSPDRVTGRVSKRSRFGSALFVERSGKRKKESEQSGPQQAEIMDDIQMEDATSRAQKRPGVSSRAAKAQGGRQPPQLPPSLQRRQYDTSTETLSREMDSWVLEHITHTLASQEAERAMNPPARATPTKYRPKAPAKRFAERHPEVASPSQGGVDVDMDGDSDTEDEDYVMETYVRVPAHTLEVSIPPEQLGVLVFDHGSDVEYFYGVEDDSEDEYLEDEEDSNDENHYTADYPEDEVESDDEYGRNDYRYRTGNASDLEEYDGAEEDEIVKSDDEGGLPGTKPWGQQSRVRAKLGLPNSRD